MNGSLAAKLITTRIRKGGNPTDSARLLTKLIASHSGDNLAHALHYNGYTTAASASRNAHALEIEHIDDLVQNVAARLRFAATVEADMGGTFALQIHLTSNHAGDTTAIRAGIDPHDPTATWWIEDTRNDQVEESTLTPTANPAHVARWLTHQAAALGHPAARTALAA